jgi:hypothetical protein
VEAKAGEVKVRERKREKRIPVGFILNILVLNERASLSG